MIQNVFRAEGLPLDLAYVPLIESAFKPTALSRAKARGVWQFMRGTAIENGLAADWYIDERADPQKATVAAAKYLKALYGMFGDWTWPWPPQRRPGSPERDEKGSRRLLEAGGKSLACPGKRVTWFISPRSSSPNPRNTASSRRGEPMHDTHARPSISARR
jgi:hypothetical protein